MVFATWWQKKQRFAGRGLSRHSRWISAPKIGNISEMGHSHSVMFAYIMLHVRFHLVQRLNDYTKSSLRSSLLGAQKQPLTPIQSSGRGKRWIKWVNNCEWVTWVTGQCRKTLDTWLDEMYVRGVGFNIVWSVLYEHREYKHSTRF